MFNIHASSELFKLFNHFWGKRSFYGSFDQLITEQPISRILDLGANVAPEGTSRMLIRAEYLFVYRKLLDLYANAKVADPFIRPGGAVITGYSGGKECLLVFILVQRLLDRLETAFSISGEILYFTDSGICRFPAEYIDVKIPFLPSADAWLLCASDSVSKNPPRQFLMRPRTNFLVNVGCIEGSVQNCWSEKRLSFLEVMNPWSLEEIEFINEHLLERPLNPLALRQAYHHSGPSLRNCLVSCTRADLDKRRIQRLKDATKHLNVALVEMDAMDITGKVGHGFLVPWRTDTGDIVTGFPSYFVAGLFYRMAVWHGLLTVEKTIEYMKSFAGIHDGAVWLFEHLCHASGEGDLYKLRSLDSGGASASHTVNFEPEQRPVSTWEEAVYSGLYFQLPQVQHDGNNVTALAILDHNVYLFAPTVFLAPQVSGTHLDEIRSECVKAYPDSDLKFHLAWLVPKDMESTFSRAQVVGGSVESQQISQYSCGKPEV